MSLRTTKYFYTFLFFVIGLYVLGHSLTEVFAGCASYITFPLRVNNLIDFSVFKHLYLILRFIFREWTRKQKQKYFSIVKSFEFYQRICKQRGIGWFDKLTVRNQIQSKKLILTEDITLADDATLVGSFIGKVSDKIGVDADGNDITEQITGFDKFDRVDNMININSQATVNNTAAISARILNTTANATSLPIINPIVQGDISLQKTISDPVLALESILDTKLEQVALSPYATITNVNTRLPSHWH